MLDITFFSLRDTVLYSITKNGLRDVVRLYNTSDRQFLICTNNLNSKKNSDFLKLKVYRIIVLSLVTPNTSQLESFLFEMYSGSQEIEAFYTSLD